MLRKETKSKKELAELAEFWSRKAKRTKDSRLRIFYKNAAAGFQSRSDRIISLRD